MSSGQTLDSATSGLGRSITAQPVQRQLTPVKIARQRIAKELRTDEHKDRHIADERKNANKAKDTYYQTRHWAQQHKLCLPQAPLPQPVLDVIEEWFFLVDDDGSGSLDAEELEAAFTACDVPCDKASIQAMVTAITHDGRHGAEIFWEDFKAFMTGEFTAGKNMLKGEYVLPGGQHLPFGLIIKRLKRHMLLSQIMAGGEDRDTVARQYKLAMLDLRAEADARDTAPPGSKRARLRDKKRRQMSLGAVVAMEQHKYTDEGVDTFDCAMEEFMEQTNLDDVLEKDRRRTMLMSMRSRTITASRRASCGLAGSTSFGSGPSRRGSLAGLSPRSGADGEAAADAAAAPFPEFEADVELQMPPLAVSPSGEICVQACSPKQVMLDVANAEGRGARTNADTDQPWRHLLSPGGPAAPPEPAAVRPPAAPSTRTGGGGEGVSVERPRRAPRRAAHEHAVKVPQRRELTPPRRSASAQPLPEPLLDVAVVHSGFAAAMRAANGDVGAGAARAARAAQAGCPPGKRVALPPLDVPAVTWSCDAAPAAALRTVHTLAPLPGAGAGGASAAISSVTLQKLLTSPTMKPAGDGSPDPVSPCSIMKPAPRGRNPSVLFQDALSDDDGDGFPCIHTANTPAAGPPAAASWAAADGAGAAWSDAVRVRLTGIDPAPIEENLPKATARQMHMHALEGVRQSVFVASMAGVKREAGGHLQMEAEVENPWDAIPLDLTLPALAQTHSC